MKPRILYYVLGAALAAAFLAAIVAPGDLWLPSQGQNPGLAAGASALNQALAEPGVYLWLLLGVSAWVFALALLAFQRQGPRDAPPAKANGSRSWRRVYALRMSIGDLLALAWAELGAELVWFGDTAGSATVSGVWNPPYRWFSLVMVVGWMAALQASGSRSYLVYGEGIEEYRRVTWGSFVWFAVLAFGALAVRLELARGYVLVSLIAGTVALLLVRKMHRMWLVVRRLRSGRFGSRVVVVGSAARAEIVIKELQRAPTSGYFVVAAALPPGEAPSPALEELGIPLVPLDDAVATMRRLQADSVVFTGAPQLGPGALRELGWQLVPGQENLIVSPDLIDIAGPRIATRPVAGLSLIHVDSPRLKGNQALLKRSLDVLVSGLLLAVLSPVLAAIAIAVKATSPGPVLFKHERIGLMGKTFNMLKFRTMVDGADKLPPPEEATGEASARDPFKVRGDPRITRVGGFLRRFSLDELPQLVNVLRNDMSLVGPRPQVAREVAQYDQSATRRLLVKPGITGLWQVSGRSDLSWEDSIRLDLYYVENWSFLRDLQILVWTLVAVFQGRGAY
ncbi:MAG: sugar transferase [Bifidobacteriaceae bacterium]|jgi:exopolysaccharide biosynthesis polyprenyl glycosylphosphotransferase|nr:sugar transferase [Bifidobacteriaceae bacterium]